MRIRLKLHFIHNPVLEKALGKMNCLKCKFTHLPSLTSSLSFSKRLLQDLKTTIQEPKTSSCSPASGHHVELIYGSAAKKEEEQVRYIFKNNRIRHMDQECLNTFNQSLLEPFHDLFNSPGASMWPPENHKYTTS